MFPMTQSVDIPVIKETEHWLVIDKPAGLMVHPVARYQIPDIRYQTTVTQWLVDRYPTITDLSWPDTDRPGIVHRLDTDTSGVLLLAKDPETLAALQQQFRHRTVTKTYQALVLGGAPDQMVLTGMIQRKEGSTEHTVKRLSFSWAKAPQKSAETSLQTIARYTPGESLRQHPKGVREGVRDTPLTLVELLPKTGRTHQLRVQLLDAGLPMLGDQQYNTKASREVSAALGLARQFLHAVKLEFDDPASGERVTVESPLPEDLRSVLDRLD